MMDVYLLKTELWISDLQYFHWLAGHRLSVHIPAVPNMVKERVSNKAAENIFAADKSRFGPEYNQHGRVVDPGVFNKTIILLGLE